MLDNPSSALIELAREYAIAAEVPDGHGDVRPVPAATLRALLSGLGVDATNDEAIEKSLESAATRGWHSPLPPVLVVREDQPLEIPVRVVDGVPADVRVDFEDGEQLDLLVAKEENDSRVVDGRDVVESLFVLPAGQPVGYHRIVLTRLESSDDDHLQVDSCELLVTPSRLEPPAGRHWGYYAQLYALRSSRSWAFGDFADLAEFADLAARKQNAGFIVLNPLHAGTPVGYRDPSPYSSISRHHLDPLYIRVEDIREVAYLPPATRALVDWEAADQAGHDTDSAPIDRAAVWEAKRSALEVVFAHPRTMARRAQFEKFRADGGNRLENFAFWCAAAEQLGPRSREWPAYMRGRGHVDAEPLLRFRERAAGRIEFYAWLQWVAAEQLSAANAAARSAGMALGIVQTVALVDDPDGVESWSTPGLLIDNVRLGQREPAAGVAYDEGAGGAPYRPEVLRELGYEPFRDVVRSALRGSAGIALHQVRGLFEQWWYPAGQEPSDGSLVGLDSEAFIGIVALEAARAGAVVFTGDVSGLSPEQEQLLVERGFVVPALLWDRAAEGDLPAAASWPAERIALLGRPELTPAAGVLAGEHLDLQEQLGLLPGDADELRRAQRQTREKILERLTSMGLADASSSERELVHGLHAYLTRTPAALIGVSVADAAGDRRTHYQPGASGLYPNWQLPLADGVGKTILLDDFFEHPRVLGLAKVLGGLE